MKCSVQSKVYPNAWAKQRLSLDQRKINNEKKLRLLSLFLGPYLLNTFPQFFTSSALSIHPLSLQGVSNHIFRAQMRTGEFAIVRLKQIYSDVGHQQISAMQKEIWISEQFRRLLPVPRQYTVRPEIIQSPDRSTVYALTLGEFLEAKAIRHQDALMHAGAIAARVQACFTTGFGPHFNGESFSFSAPSWDSYIRTLHQDLRIDCLRKMLSLNTGQLREIDRVFNSLSVQKPTPVLYHRDFLMNHGNLLYTERSDSPFLIDWELAGSGMGVPEEFASALYVMLRDSMPAQKRAMSLNTLLRGYGMTRQEFKECHEQNTLSFLTLIAIEKAWRYREMLQFGPPLPDWQLRFAQRVPEILDFALLKRRYIKGRGL